AGLMVIAGSPPAAAQFNSGSNGSNGVFPPVPQGGMPNDAYNIVWNVKTGLVRYCSSYTVGTGSDQCNSDSVTNVTAQIPNPPTDSVYQFTDVNIPAIGSQRQIVPVNSSPNQPLAILSQGDIFFAGGGNGFTFWMNGWPGKNPQQPNFS